MIQGNPTDFQSNPSSQPASASPSQGKQPVLLIVMCILTLVASLVMIISNLITFLFTPRFYGAMLQEEVMGITAWLPLLIVVLAAGRIFGSALMLSRRKAGLYVYTISQALAIVVHILGTVAGVILLKGLDARMEEISMGMADESQTAVIAITVAKAAVGTLVSIAFIIGYWTQRKHLR